MRRLRSWPALPAILALSLPACARAAEAGGAATPAADRGTAAEQRQASPAADRAHPPLDFDLLGEPREQADPALRRAIARRSGAPLDAGAVRG